MDTLTEDLQSGDTQTEDPSTEGHDFEKRYNDVRSWSTKLSQENKELRSNVDNLSGLLSAIMETVGKNNDPQEEPKEWLQDVDPIDLIDDPSALVQTLRTLKSQQDSFKDDVSKLLDMRDSALSERFSQYSPEAIQQKQQIEAYSEQIAELKNDPALADIPDIALAKIAERMTPEASQPFRLPSVGGHRVSVDRGKQDDKVVDAFLKANGYTKENGFN